ncbi:MAG TPA: hypothetical protein VGL19_00925, partial [Polyangiaceae bacterium]
AGTGGAAAGTGGKGGNGGTAGSGAGGSAGHAGAGNASGAGGSAAGAGPVLYVPASSSCAAGNVQAAMSVCRNCHTDPPINSAPVPLLSYDEIHAEAGNILDKVSSGEMPAAGTLSTANKGLILDWVGAGAIGVPNPACP